MKLSPDSPELTAYVLGELPPEQHAAVEAALARSPELAAEVRELSQTAGMLQAQLAAEPAVQLDARQRQAVLQPPPPTMVASSRRRPGTSRGSWGSLFRAPWVWGTATAAFAALALTLTLWPQRRSLEEEFSSLRYQTPAQAPARAPAPSATSASPEAAGAAPTLAEAPADPAPGQVTRMLSTLDSKAEEAGRKMSAAEAPQQAGNTLSLAQAPAGALPSDRAATQGADNFYRMDPALARRYGLMPRREASPAAPAPARPESKVSLGVELQDATRGRDALARYDRADSLADLPQLTEKRELLQRGMLLSVPPAAADFRETSLAYRPIESPGTESYAAITDNPFKSPAIAPLSTFGLDVDTASYANVRRFLREGSLPPPDAVRIEELINYFSYDSAPARGDHPLAAAVEIADCPWAEGHKLVRVAVQAKAVDRAGRPPANLVFLLDVSGSMAPENKLPLVKRSLRLLLDRLTERDSVGIVTYAGESRVALEPVTASESGRRRITEVLEGLGAGSGTAGSAGIQAAYALAGRQFIPGGVNRVLLCTDGDFNIGITDPAELHRLIEERAKSGVFLSVLGYGMGNTKDSTMELLADRGNGNYAYVDSFAEARKVLGEQLEGTLITVAKDVKVQVEFNPARVRSYRLIGYENRALRDRDFNDDTKDAGDVGAGHQVTVLYEIEPATPNLAGTDPLRYQGAPADAPVAPAIALKRGHEDELLLLKIRYKSPEGTESRLLEQPVKDVSRELDQASADFRFASAVAGYGMLLRNSPHKGTLAWDRVLRLAEQGLGNDREGYRAEFVDLARKAQALSGGR
ncbi:MAG: von Willebrand factor type A domain-containing protein [Verrucomicrobia bacterium]|nr:von Willebrand factor type A domain-containing protein [Verrucomicrobiota bacterium]